MEDEEPGHRRLSTSDVRFFTIVVVAILLLSMGLFIHDIRVHNGRVRTCMGNVKCLALSLQMYADDYDGCLPNASGDQWVLPVRDHLDSYNVLYCPEDSDALRSFQRVSRETHDEGANDVILRMSQEGLRLTSYEFPKGCAGLKMADVYDAGMRILLWERTARHGKYRVAGYCDGHVAKLKF